MSDDLDAMSTRLAELEKRKGEAQAAGTERAIEAQRARGKMTARERVDTLLDKGSFQELDTLVRHRAYGVGLDNNRPYTDGVVTGFGTVNGRRIAVFSQDFTVLG